MDVGYYYCGPMIADKKFFEPNFKKIYVYVQGECLSKFDNRNKIIHYSYIFPKIINILFHLLLKYKIL